METIIYLNYYDRWHLIRFVPSHFSNGDRFVNMLNNVFQRWGWYFSLCVIITCKQIHLCIWTLWCEWNLKIMDQLLIKISFFFFTNYSQDVVRLNLKPVRYTGMICKSYSNRQFLFLARLRTLCKIQEAVRGRIVQYSAWI